MTQLTSDRWMKGRIKTLEDVDRTLGRLETLFRQTQDMVEFGPVPGAYFPVTFVYNGSFGVTAVLQSQFIPNHIQIRPVAISAFLGTGSCNFRLKDSGTSIMASTMTLGVSGKTGSIATRPDFDLDSISGRINLEITVASLAADITVLLIGKAVTQAEEI